MALQAVEIEDILICGFLLVPSATYRLFKIQRWDSPASMYYLLQFDVHQPILF